jgi:regulator of protease activity HflC (stomatin/prohibitin superfamily)
LRENEIKNIELCVRTQDGDEVNLRYSLHYQVVDPEKTVLNIADPLAAIKNGIEDSLQEISKTKVKSDLIVPTTLDQIAADLKWELSSRISQWGIKLSEIKLS